MGKGKYVCSACRKELGIDAPGDEDVENGLCWECERNAIEEEERRKAEQEQGLIAHDL